MLTALVLSFVVSQSVELPRELRRDPGEWIVVVPKVDGGAPRWRVSPGLEEVDLGGLFGPEATAKMRGKVFRSKVAGTYTVECWNAKGDLASEIAVCRVVIGTPGPGPDPVDPVIPPSPLTPFGKQIKTWAEQVDRPTRKAEAAALAKSFRAGQSAARAGAFADLQAMSASLLASNRAAIGEDARPAWTPAFFVPLAASLNESVKTVDHYAGACGEIADGLLEASK